MLPYVGEVPRLLEKAPRAAGVPARGQPWTKRDGLKFAKNTRPLMMANANQKGALIMNYDYRVTGQIIGRLRVQREMSQEALSGLAGIARSHLAMIENGRKRANVETLWRLAAALDMRMSELMRMVEDEMDYVSHVTKP